MTGGQFLALAILSMIVIAVTLLSANSAERERYDRDAHRELLRELRRYDDNG